MSSPLKSILWLALAAYTMFVVLTAFNPYIHAPWSVVEFSGDPEIAAPPDQLHANENIFDRLVKVIVFLLIGAGAWCLLHCLLPAARENQAEQNRYVSLICALIVVLSFIVPCLIGWQSEPVIDAHHLEAEEEPPTLMIDGKPFKGFGDVD